MAKKSDKQYTNPAIQLHGILATLIGQSNSNQRDGLCAALSVDPRDRSIFYARLAGLHQMPDHVKVALQRMDADPIFLEWHHPISTAISRLDGSSNTNLGHLKPPALTEPLVKLYMCRTMLPDELEMRQLDAIRTSIVEAISQVNKAEDIDLSLRAQLLGILQDAMSALQEAEVFGLDAAKRKLYAVIGRVQVDPIPTPDTDREKAIFKTVGSVCAEVFKWAQFAENLGKIAGLLQ